MTLPKGKGWMLRAIASPLIIAAAIALAGPPAAAQSATPNPLACFCLHNPVEAYFLWGCQDATPRHDVTKQAICWNRQTDSKDTAPVKIVPPWIRIEAGQGSCSPCRATRSVPPDIPRN